jgi:hypothetical protein
VGEAELLEEDGGAGVVLEGILLDLRRRRGKESPRDSEEEEEERAGGGGHRGEIWVRATRERGARILEARLPLFQFLMRGFGRWGGDPRRDW